MQIQKRYRLTAQAWRTAPVVPAPGTARTVAAFHAGQQ